MSLLVNGVFGFKGEYDFLSNFYFASVRMDGVEYPTLEHAYQAAKTLNVEEQARIREAFSPGQAKKMGKYVDLRPDWNDIRVSVMKKLLRSKFTFHYDLSLKLYNTADLYLEETNYWNDEFWGVCNGKGQNVLGNLLMSVREEIKVLHGPVAQ